MIARNLYLVILSILIELTLLSSCKLSPPTNEYRIGINVDLAERYEPKYLFDSIHITPLETSPESVLQKCSKLIVKDSLCFIIDNSQRAVYVFDMHGNFLFNTKNLIGRGPGEYHDAIDFDINPVTNRIEILDPAVSRIATYDFAGSFVEYHYLPKEIMPLGKFKILTDDCYLFFSGINDYNGKNFIFWSKSQKKLIKYDLELSEKLDGFPTVNPMPFYTFQSKLFFASSYVSKDVYLIDPSANNITLAFSFSFFGRNCSTLDDLPANTTRNDKLDFPNALSDKYAIPYTPGETLGFYYTFFYYKKELHYAKYNKADKSVEVYYSVFGEKYQIPPPHFVDEESFIYLSKPSHIPFSVSTDLLNEANRIIYDSIDAFDNPYIIRYYFRKATKK